MKVSFRLLFLVYQPWILFQWLINIIKVGFRWSISCGMHESTHIPEDGNGSWADYKQGVLLKVFSRIVLKKRLNAAWATKCNQGGIQPNARVSRTQGGIWHLWMHRRAHHPHEKTMFTPHAFWFYLVLPRVTLESASTIKINQNLLKLTSIRMSNLKAVGLTNTYQFPLCPYWACWQVALCESLLDLPFQWVAIHICLSPDQLHFLSLSKQGRID